MTKPYYTHCDVCDAIFEIVDADDLCSCCEWDFMEEGRKNA